MNYELLKAFYRAGWRPGIGWVVVAACVVQWIARPLIGDAVLKLDVADLIAMLGAAGAMAGLRTVERMGEKA